MKLRLLLFKDCNRSCEGCCNKQWDLDALPVCSSYDFSEIMLTGGEPMLRPELVKSMVTKIRTESNAKIYMYTADCSKIEFYDLLELLDGVTLTLHEQKDIKAFLKLNTILNCNEGFYFGKSLKLNIFKEVQLPEGIDLSMWKVKDNMVWIKDCPLPSDEVFIKLGG